METASRAASIREELSLPPITGYMHRNISGSSDGTLTAASTTAVSLPPQETAPVDRSRWGPSAP